MRTTLSVFIALAISATSALARPYLKIQQVRPLEYPYVKVELSVARITPILNLNESNFELFENGWHVPALQVKPANNAKDPKNIVLLVDSSRSISVKQFRQQMTAVKGFAENLGPRDRIALLSFNDRVEAHCGFTGDKAQLMACINSVRQNGKKTVLYDAILEGLTMAARLKAARNSLVVFTDGRDEGSIIELNDIVSATQRGSVPVFVAGTGSRSKLKSLARLSRLSGGETYHTPHAEDLKKIYLLLNQLLANTYLLQYVSQASKTSVDGRKVEIEVHLKAQSEDKKPFSDEDKYTFMLPTMVLSNWWQNLWNDERYLLFTSGLIILLLLIVTILALTRRPNIQVGAPPAPVPDFIDEPPPPVAARPSAQFPPKKSMVETGPSSEPESFQAYLVEKEGPNTGRKYKIMWNSISIGHGDENSIVLEDNSVSYRHAKIHRRKNQFVVYDLLSEYGTFLNGKKLLRPKELYDFDELQLGRTKLIFRRASNAA